MDNRINSIEFLKYITDNHNVYWLTTYCKGNAGDTVNYLKLFFSYNDLVIISIGAFLPVQISKERIP